MTLEKQVAAIKEAAQKNNITSVIQWAIQAEYMLNQYRGTKYETQTIATIKQFIKGVKIS